MLNRVLGSIVYFLAAYIVSHSTELSTAAQTVLALGINSALHAAEHYITSSGGK